MYDSWSPCGRRTPTPVSILCDWKANQGNPKGRLILILFRLAQFIRNWPAPWWLIGAPYLLFYEIFVEWILCVELRFKTRVGASLRLYHAHGLVVHEGTVIGTGCILRQGTTIGNKQLADGTLSSCPILGNDVDVGANVCIIGPIKIGNRVVVGAGSVVVKDVPADAVVAGNPARIVRQLPS
jgi:putative colanic acid biosynthesis acetyltransferase WcaB